METSPPIHQLPNELLVKIIEKLPRTQWPALELVDRKFRDAVILAWGSVRMVDVERDFIYSPKALEYAKNHDMLVDLERLCRQISRKMESILRMLSERSPFITSLRGLMLINRDQPTIDQYLREFEHLETIEFKKYLSSRFVNGMEIHLSFDTPPINVIEFLETTRSRAALKEIIIEQCSFTDHNTAARLRAAFDNVSTNDPTRELLRLESFSMRLYGPEPFTFFDTIDASRMTNLSLGYTRIDPVVLTNFINAATQLQHLAFSFCWSCNSHSNNAPACQGGRVQSNKNLLAALESRRSLASLEFNKIWARRENVNGCTCNQFETEFKKMLRTIGPQLLNFVFHPGFLLPNMGDIRDIIQRHMPQLKSIALGDICFENPEDLRGIADGKKLEEIEIALYFRNAMDADYMAIFNEVMSTIIIKSPRLRRFNGANYCPDQRMVEELCKLSHLIDLRIEANHMTEENFLAFSQQVFAEKLQILHLRRIGEGMEPGLIELIGKAAQLRELMAYGNVTDHLLECMAESSGNLEKFRALSACDGITFNGLQMLVDRCPKLRWLRVDNTTGTFVSSLKNLKVEQYRKLEVEHPKFY